MSTPVTRRMLDFLDKWLGQRPVDFSSVPSIEVRSSNDTEAHAAPGWSALDRRTFYLANPDGSPATGTLSTSPVASDSLSAMDVDPSTMDPCDAVAYPALAFSSTTLTSSLYILGSPTVELVLSATTPDVDLFATLWEWAPDQSVPSRIALGTLRARYRDPATPALLPASAVNVKIEMAPIAHRVPTGSQLLLVVAPGMCGWFENPQSGEGLTAQTRRARATIQLHHTQSRSRLELPVADFGK
jgi:predicted acyl esterase